MFLNKINAFHIRRQACNVINRFAFHNTSELVVEAKHLSTERVNPFEKKKTLREERRNVEKRLCFDDPDSFGTLAGGLSHSLPEEPLDEDELMEEKFISESPTTSQILSTKQYADLIKDHFKNMRIKEAIDMVEVRMIQEDRVKPENYIFNLLIGGCARVGYTKKAFMLFNDMKKRGLKPTGGTYTSLFNACANSPWPETDGRDRALRLRAHMHEKAIETNPSIYNAMIKAFSRCSDLKSSFQIMDEMLSKKIKLRYHSFAFLTQSCISDKESGFRHALIIWKKMIQRREKPTIYNFNLLLKCIKDCGLGNVKQVEEMLRILYGSSVTLLIRDENALNVAPVSETALVVTPQNETVQLFRNVSKNFMGKHKIIDVNSFCALTKPHEKFLLIGACDGLFSEMKKYNVTPDIKTFTLLLYLIPDTLEAEEKLLERLAEYPKVHPDIDFFNMLMKKRCYRMDYDAAKSVFKLIKKHNKKREKKIFFNRRLEVKPDIVTHGVLALTCRTFEEGKEFLKEMDESRKRCNIEIMGTLLRQAMLQKDVDYVHHVMDRVKTDEIEPNKIFLDRLQSFSNQCYYIRRDTEDREVHSKIDKFQNAYAKWVGGIDVDGLVENEHPWTQFRVPQKIPFQRPKQKLVKRRYYKRPGKPYRRYVP